MSIDNPIIHNLVRMNNPVNHNPIRMNNPINHNPIRMNNSINHNPIRISNHTSTLIITPYVIWRAAGDVTSDWECQRAGAIPLVIEPPGTPVMLALTQAFLEVIYDARGFKRKFCIKSEWIQNPMRVASIRRIQRGNNLTSSAWKCLHL